jgi:glycosyltransferase involved in cell wall biosynthesis
MKILIGSPSPDSWGGPAACEPPFVGALKRAGHEVHEVTYVYGDKAEATSALARVRRVARSARELRRALKEQKFDVVHINTAFDLKTIVRDAYSISRMPRGPHRLFLKMHGSDARAYIKSGPVLRRMIRYIARRAGGIGVLSSEEREDFAALGFDRGKIFKVLNVVELDAASERHQRNNDEISLLFVSRLIPTKGLVETIRAAKILKESGVRFQLTVVGDGETREQAERLTRELGLDGNITFTGYIAETDVARHLAAGDVFVFPTRHIEGQPVALYKAAIAGLAIVTTKVRSASDLLTDEVNCLFCTAVPEDIAAKIKRLIDDAGLRKSMADNNRAFRELLSAEKVAAEYVSIYQQLAK